MIKLLPLTILLLIPPPAIAQPTCTQNAKTQLDLNDCANQDFAEADRNLNRAYAQLLAKNHGNPQAVTKIKAAEHAWLAYRDATLEAMFPAEDKQSEYGTMYPMQAARFQARLTRQQTAILRDLQAGP